MMTKMTETVEINSADIMDSNAQICDLETLVPALVTEQSLRMVSAEESYKCRWNLKI